MPLDRNTLHKTARPASADPSKDVPRPLAGDSGQRRKQFQSDAAQREHTDRSQKGDTREKRVRRPAGIPFSILTYSQKRNPPSSTRDSYRQGPKMPVTQRPSLVPGKS